MSTQSNIAQQFYGRHLFTPVLEYNIFRVYLKIVFIFILLPRPNIR